MGIFVTGDHEERNKKIAEESVDRQVHREDCYALVLYLCWNAASVIFGEKCEFSQNA